VFCLLTPSSWWYTALSFCYVS